MQNREEMSSTRQSWPFYVFLPYNVFGWLVFYIEELFRNLQIDKVRFSKEHEAVLYCTISAILGFLFTTFTYSLINGFTDRSIKSGRDRFLGVKIFFIVIFASFLACELSFLFSPNYPNSSEFSNVFDWRAQANQYRAWLKWMMIWTLFYYFGKYLQAFKDERKLRLLREDQLQRDREYNLNRFSEESLNLNKEIDSLKLKIASFPSTQIKLKETLDAFYEENGQYKIKLLELEQNNEVCEKTIQDINTKILGQQMDQHLLVNILSNIRAKINLEEDETAAEMLGNLCDLMRYIVYDRELVVPLKKEIGIINKFIYIMKQRWDNLIFTIDWKAFGLIDEYYVTIPPLLLQTLIENAVKHGVAPLSGDGEIKLSLRLEGDYIVYVITNPGEYKPNIEIKKNIKYGGRGIEWSKLRLNEIYKNDENVGITIGNSNEDNLAEENHVITEVTIPYRKDIKLNKISIA